MSSELETLLHFIHPQTKTSIPYNPSTLLPLFEKAKPKTKLQALQLKEFKFQILLEMGKTKEAEQILYQIPIRNTRFKVLELTLQHAINKAASLPSESGAVSSASPVKGTPKSPKPVIVKDDSSPSLVTQLTKLRETEGNLFLEKKIALALYESLHFNEAIEHLLNHLDTFYQDIESIQFLIDLYLRKAMYSQAYYLQQEILILKPSFHEFLNCANIAYALGEYTDSLMYYLKSVKDVPDALLGWYGVHCCSKVLGDIELIELAKQEITRLNDTPLVSLYLRQ